MKIIVAGCASGKITGEKSAGYMIFQSNQGTSRHLDHKLDASSLEPYMAGTISGSISKTPQTLQGGHVIFNVLTANGSVPCAVYKESGMGGALCNLAIGDEVTVGGGIRPASKSRPRTMNVEFVRVRGLKIVHEQRNPHCIKCHKNMKSKGSGQHYECIKCGRSAISKETIRVARALHLGAYLPVVSAQRHLTRPAQRKKRTNIPVFVRSSRWFCEF